MTYKIDEVAKILRVSPSIVRAWVRDGSLRAIDVTKPENRRRQHLRILQQDLQEFQIRRETTRPRWRTPEPATITTAAD